MPRTNLCENKAQKRYDYVAGLIAGGFKQNHLGTKDISSKTGIPERTVTQRLEHPEKIRLEDLYKICDLAGVRISFEFKDIPD